MLQNKGLASIFFCGKGGGGTFWPQLSSQWMGRLGGEQPAGAGEEEEIEGQEEEEEEKVEEEVEEEEEDEEDNNW